MNRRAVLPTVLAPALLCCSIATAQDAEIDGIQEIVVTGSRIATQSGFAAPTPVTVLGAEQMQMLGISNVGEALNQLPSFNPSTTLSTQGFGGIGAVFADLRGLGANRNLVLLNGRRIVPTNVSGNVDLNLLPSMMILRSEVVTGGASAAYGSDAVAGVTNILLDTRLTGWRAQVDYGGSQEGDDRSRSASVAGGFPFADGRGHLIAGAEYARSSGVGDQYSRDWSALEVQRIPNSAVPGQPFNILAYDVHNSNATVGGYIRNARTATGAAPPAAADPLRGFAFNQNGTIVRYTPGQYAAGSPFQVGGSGHGENVYLGGGQNMVSPIERYSAHVHGEFDLTDTLQAFAEATYASAEATNPAGQFRAEGYNISIENPFIPQGVRNALVAGGFSGFALGRNGTDLGSAITNNDRNTLRFATGLSGALANDWKWDTWYQYGRTRSDNEVSNNRIGKTATSDPAINNFAMAVDAVWGGSGVAAVPMCRVVRNALVAGTPLQPGQSGYGCQPLNILGANNFSPEAKAYAYGTSSQETKIQQHAIAANLTGELVELWAGPLSAAVGIELRKDSADATADPISKRDGWFVGVGQDVDASMEVKEGYLEGALPLIGGARKLDLNGAFRYTQYDVEGRIFPTTGAAPTPYDSSFDANTWKVGLTFEPFESLRLRVTRSRDIRAPNISELFGARVRGFATTTDHGRSEQVPLALVLGGGNPALQPEKADTWTAGLVFQPQWGDGRLRVALDYYDISIDGAIGTIGSQTIMDRCYLQGAADLCPLIRRLPPTAGQTVGVLDYIENTLQNINQLETRGIDLEADYRLPTPVADLSFRVLGTFVIDYITRDAAGATDRAGQTGWPVGAPAGVPDLVLDAFVSASRGPATLTLQAHYVDSGFNNPLQIGPDDSRYAAIVAAGAANPLYTATTNDNLVGSRLYFNLNGSWDLVPQTDGGTSVQLFARVANLLNTDPPLTHTVTSATNQRYFDPIGRAFKIGVRLRH